MSNHTISAATWQELDAEQTNTHRVHTTHRGWVDRFGDDYLVSAMERADATDLVEAASRIGTEFHTPPRRIFLRLLVKQPGASDVPELVVGESSGSLQCEVSERGIRYQVDFSAGYSVGLFMDQRLNRAHLASLQPARVLNCFAYTAAFSVVAALAGAETCSIDLAKKALTRGQKNFTLNGLDPARGHQWIADDVFRTLPRLARRGAKFDAIIIDPPTFSRGAKGDVFRVEDDFPRLVELARAVANPGSSLLLSTNSKMLQRDDLIRAARETGPVAKVLTEADQSEYPPQSKHQTGVAAASVWIKVPG